MVFLYSPLMSNVKFIGSFSDFIVLASNTTNFFNYYYFGANFLLEALISGFPLVVLQCWCLSEFET